MGDDWSPAIAHETGHQTAVCRNVSTLILQMKFCCTAFFIIHMEQRNGARTIPMVWLIFGGAQSDVARKLWAPGSANGLSNGGGSRSPMPRPPIHAQT